MCVCVCVMHDDLSVLIGELTNLINSHSLVFIDRLGRCATFLQ
jgi:hypothetical protein